MIGEIGEFDTGSNPAVGYEQWPPAAHGGGPHCCVRFHPGGCGRLHPDCGTGTAVGHLCLPHAHGDSDGRATYSRADLRTNISIGSICRDRCVGGRQRRVDRGRVRVHKRARGLAV